MITDALLTIILSRVALGERVQDIVASIPDAPTMIELRDHPGFKARVAQAKAAAQAPTLQ